ncbi:NADH dehydrogenase 1 alpha subcomplex assembly factor 4 isoform X2 [Notolabrus celidotus] [Xyrichtys novacula]|uniref:NADH dehydrogenase [ubiquinone] 1 alpha subcomplex assembly factor 4 n=1 Tax=Xyrichtys novacula TaxID=13765 RepID=A0AAV1GWQ9_XYRNO|nr:NADH dehydrogenase 1 alpha subcomplex assembly factor 4 isoform X2 [Notolabrus celidotus] [Xyrichtys novacula]
MGARVVRMFRNFNLENRVFREISKEKPQAAPRHTVTVPPPPDTSGAETESSVQQKNDPLLKLLKSVYVESTDPAAAETSKEETTGVESERRPLKFSLPGDPFSLVELTDVPKGKLTIVEALKALNSHQRQPETMTPDRIAKDYSLDLKDTKALLQFFVPFQVEIIPPKTKDTKKLKAS